MKLLRYGPSGHEKPGLLDAEGNIRDISGIVSNIDSSVLAPKRLAHLRKFSPAKLPLVRGNPRLGVPYTGISKFIAIGLNYSDHAAESNMPVELAIVIGTTARYVSEDEALDHVAGYTIVNDVSERNFQLERGGSWDKGKGCDTFGPIGPLLVTTDEITDPHVLDMWLDVNGEKKQRGSTRTMIFNCKQLVSYVSQYMTLLPGDIITTGTPPGVGAGMKPPQFLKPGDVMTLGIQGLGEQRQKVVAWSA